MTELSKREQNRLQKAAELAECAHARGDQVIGEYTTAREKVAIRCYKGHLFSIKPSHYKRGVGCAACGGMNPERNKMELIEIAKIYGDQVIGEYKNADTKIEMLSKDNKTFFVFPYYYKMKHKKGLLYKKENTTEPNKPKAKKSKAIQSGVKYLRGHEAHAAFCELAKSRGDQVVGEYKNACQRVEMKCGKQKHVFFARPNDYKKGHGCPKCAKLGFKQGKQGVLYVVRWKIKNRSFIKYGITGDVDQRLKEQERYTDFTPEIITTVKHEDGQNTAELERQIKAVQAKHGGAAITKDDFADGYTETVKDTPEVLEDIQAAIKSFCFGL